MSYSFRVVAANKAAAAIAIEAELAKVVAGQPVHQADLEQAKAAGAAFLGVIADAGEGERVVVQMHGSVGGVWENGGYSRLTSASVGVSAYVERATSA